MTRAIDPTRVVYADMLLSEFVGNDSVYRHGYANPVQTDLWSSDGLWSTWRFVARMLATLRGELVAPSGDGGGMNHFSISYGWIHPRLSQRIVTWKNGGLPSYHRWDAGAAFDINFHACTFVPYYGICNIWDRANPLSITAMHTPIGIASACNSGRHRPSTLDRTITYSESPWICLASCSPGSFGAGKFYENRYEGRPGDKPRFITWAKGAPAPRRHPSGILPCDWRGSGYPTKHGGGRRQYHHIRTGLFTVVSDWLYSRDHVHFGRPNRMPVSISRHEHIVDMMHTAGSVYDLIQSAVYCHLPIIEGIQFADRISNWEENGRWSFVIAYTDHDGCMYDTIRETLLPKHADMYPGLEIERLPSRAYVDIRTGDKFGWSRNLQERIRISGETHDGLTQTLNYDRAATSSECGDGARGDDLGSVSDGGRVAPTRRRASRAGEGDNRERSRRTRASRR